MMYTSRYRTKEAAEEHKRRMADIQEVLDKLLINEEPVDASDLWKILSAIKETIE